MKKHLTLLIIGVFALLPVQSALGQGSRPYGSNVRAQEAHARSQEARQESEERVENVKQKVAERKATIKQEVCERRQQRLQTVMPRLATGAKSVKSSIDKVYSRVQGFYETGQLTVANYDELNGNVTDAKVNSEDALAAVESYEFELDCDNPNVGQQLDGYRVTIKEARDSLKAYRTELVELISAMRAAAADEADEVDEASNDAANNNARGTEESESATEGVNNDQE